MRVFSFVWPDLPPPIHPVSECTDYPDFTVVALYKSMVVGAAFMTPEEVHYSNALLRACGHSGVTDLPLLPLSAQAYVTYIAVHPEWRGAGIATFMMYHLIQVRKLLCRHQHFIYTHIY